MVPPFTDLLPDVSVGYIGLERDEDTAVARSYYCKLPPLSGKRVLILDPMLATGGSAVQAIEIVHLAWGPVGRSKSRLYCLCTRRCPRGQSPRPWNQNLCRRSRPRTQRAEIYLAGPGRLWLPALRNLAELPVREGTISFLRYASVIFGQGPSQTNGVSSGVSVILCARLTL